MLVAPPIGTIATPSAASARPRRSASASSAAWSLVPSTSTTARTAARPGRSRFMTLAAGAGRHC